MALIIINQNQEPIVGVTSTNVKVDNLPFRRSQISWLNWPVLVNVEAMKKLSKKLIKKTLCLSDNGVHTVL